MASLRTLVLEGVDTLAVSFQTAFQSYGFLSDSRETVVERDAGGTRFALLPDKSGEGWSAVEFPLPVDA